MSEKSNCQDRVKVAVVRIRANEMRFTNRRQCNATLLSSNCYDLFPECLIGLLTAHPELIRLINRRPSLPLIVRLGVPSFVERRSSCLEGLREACCPRVFAYGDAVRGSLDKRPRSNNRFVAAASCGPQVQSCSCSFVSGTLPARFGALRKRLQPAKILHLMLGVHGVTVRRC